MKLATLLLALAALPAFAEFRIADDGKSLHLTENGAPVFSYNYGAMLKPGAPEDRTRCCYLHPVYAPNGAVVTDDFPKDHYHHRGIFWAWQIVKLDGKEYDLWAVKGIHARHGKFLKKTGAVIEVENHWFIGDRDVAIEHVTITTHPVANGTRNIDLDLRFTSKAGVEIEGERGAHKGYGGLNIRFAPRTNTKIATQHGEDVKDSDMILEPWAELTATYGDKTAATRVTAEKPEGWCLRHYGFIGSEYPGLNATIKLDGLHLKYQVRLTAK